MTETAISLVQLPVIREQLAPLSAEIDREVTEALALAVTPDTLAQVKKVRAKIRKDFDELEKQRKALKSAILAKYEEFEEQVYKPLIAIRVEEGDTELKRKINAVEAQLRQEKIDYLRDYFEELVSAEHLDWLVYERGNFNVTMSKSKTALRSEVDEFVGRVASDTKAIEVMPDAEEVLVEYKRLLRLGEAVEIVKRRREEVEQARRERERLEEMRRAEQEAELKVKEALEQVAPPTAEQPVQETDPVRTLKFTVTAPLSKLRDLKRFLTEGGYEIG